MKNILLINLGRQYGGAEKITEDIMYNNDKNKFNIHLLCIRNSTLHTKNKNSFENIRILPKNKALSLLYIPLATLYILKYKIEVIHCNGIVSSILGTVCGIISRKRIITTIHGRADFDRNNSIKGKIFSWIELKLFKSNDKYITVSHYLERHLCAKLEKKEKITTIYNNIKFDDDEGNIDYKKIYYRDNDFVVCSIGRLEQVKGHIYLIKAIKMLRDNNIDIKCIIAGEGSCKESLEKFIEENNLKDNVKFVGFIENPSKLIGSCEIFINPSLMESFGLVIIEAMREKKCIIATNVGGVPELIAHNKNGYLVDSCNEKQIFEQILYCYYNPTEIKQVASCAYDTYKLKWENYDMIREYEALYESL